MIDWGRITPLGHLINARCEALGITRGELARRLGYANLGKGARRIDGLVGGDLARVPELINRLPEALDLAPNTIAQAVDETQREAERLKQEHIAAEEAEWRASFRPHAIIITERTIPSSITQCIFTGGSANRRIDIDASRPRASFISQALNELNARLTRWRGQIPYFGKPTGLVVNYTPDRAVAFSLQGAAEQILPKAFRIQDGSLSIGGRRVSSGELAAFLEKRE